MKTSLARAALLMAAAAMTVSAETPTHAAPGLTAPQPAQAAPESHLGFDTNKYPGDAAMDAWKKTGKYDWVGYYLQASCHKDASWMGKRASLVKDGWGLAVVYVGQQTWGDASLPAATTSTPADRCASAFVNADQGKLDAKDAISVAQREGFDKGTVIFLDVEAMDNVPQRMRDYYATFARTLLEDGRYYPGIYAHTKNASAIYDDVKKEYDRAKVDADPPFWIASTRGFSERAMPTDVGHDFATMWQGKLDITRSHNGVTLPVDINVSSNPSPSDALQ